jgi:hypothetical protein
MFKESCKESTLGAEAGFGAGESALQTGASVEAVAAGAGIAMDAVMDAGIAGARPEILASISSVRSAAIACRSDRSSFQRLAAAMLDTTAIPAQTDKSVFMDHPYFLLRGDVESVEATVRRNVKPKALPILGISKRTSRYCAAQQAPSASCAAAESDSHNSCDFGAIKECEQRVQPFYGAARLTY